MGVRSVCQKCVYLDNSPFSREHRKEENLIRQKREPASAPVHFRIHDIERDVRVKQNAGSADAVRQRFLRRNVPASDFRIMTGVAVVTAGKQGRWNQQPRPERVLCRFFLLNPGV